MRARDDFSSSRHPTLDYERWRNASVSHEASTDDDLRDAVLAPRCEFAPPQSAYTLDPARFKRLKKPFDGV